jgi:uncharacterized membrane protein YphA (DoxX/SURF4 family)
MAQEFIDAIEQRIRDLFGGAWHWLIEPLYLIEWYAWLALILGACLLIGYFAPFKWVRAALGLILLVAGAFVAGGTAMWRHLRRDER